MRHDELVQGWFESAAAFAARKAEAEKAAAEKAAAAKAAAEKAAYDARWAPVKNAGLTPEKRAQVHKDRLAKQKQDFIDNLDALSILTGNPNFDPDAKKPELSQSNYTQRTAPSHAELIAQKKSPISDKNAKAAEHLKTWKVAREKAIADHSKQLKETLEARQAIAKELVSSAKTKHTFFSSKHNTKVAEQRKLEAGLTPDMKKKLKSDRAGYKQTQDNYSETTPYTLSK